MRTFLSTVEVDPIKRSNEHGGQGLIEWRRLLSAEQFASKIDFVDVTVVPPGSSIGRHQHINTEELYYVVAGEPLVRVDAAEQRLGSGDISIVRSGQHHQLVNDTLEPVRILVIQIRL